MNSCNHMMRPLQSTPVRTALLLVCLAFTFWTNRSQAATAEYVVQVSLDGLGAVYLEPYVNAAPEQFPNFVRLMNEGAYTFNARCDYDISETVPNHICMFTARPVFQPLGFPDTTHHGYNNNFPGASDTIHNAGNVAVPYKSSMFDVAHDHGLSTAFYAGKTRLEICDRSYDEFNGALDLIGADNGRDKIDVDYVADISGTSISNEVNELVANLTSGAPAHYSFIHIAEPDLTGHSASWGSVAWSNVVPVVDAQLGRILDTIQTEPLLAGRTALIVTADHGGGGVNARGHTESYHPWNYTIPFFLWGPQVPPQTDLYSLMLNRGDPGTNWVDYTVAPQPIRNSDGSNLALALLGLPPIPDSFMQPELGALGVRLGITLDHGAVHVTWTDPANRYVLETSVGALDHELPVWERVTEGIEIDGNDRLHQVPEVNGPDPVFFRLRQIAFAITSQPASQTVFAGTGAQLEVGVSGEGPFSYQWYKDESVIAQAQEAQLVLATVSGADAGAYRVEVSDSLDTLSSMSATLTVLLAPVITQQPVSQAVLAGAQITLVVGADGAAPLTYQWSKDDVELDGATAASYVIDSMDFEHVGSYTVVVSDANGSVESDPAVLDIAVPLSFVERPASQTVPVGGTATFTTQVQGYPPPFSYTWRKLGGATLTNEVSDSTTSTFTLNNVQVSDGGSYQVIVRNSFNTNGLASTPFATLTVE